MNLTRKKTALLALALIAMIGTVYAVYWIYSNTVTVHVTEYALTLAPPEQTVVKGYDATFTATLTLAGNPISGATIHLLYANETDTLVSGSCK